MPSPQILLIKELRRRIAAGVMDCNQALLKCDGDVEAAIKLLQASHMASVKPRRNAPEGVVACALDRKQGALVELAAETDFVGRNPRLVDAAAQIARVAFDGSGDRDRTLMSPSPDGNGDVADFIARLAGGVQRDHIPATYFELRHTRWGLGCLRPQQSGAECRPRRYGLR